MPDRILTGLAESIGLNVTLLITFQFCPSGLKSEVLLLGKRWGPSGAAVDLPVGCGTGFYDPKAPMFGSAAYVTVLRIRSGLGRYNGRKQQDLRSIKYEKLYEIQPINTNMGNTVHQVRNDLPRIRGDKKRPKIPDEDKEYEGQQILKEMHGNPSDTRCQI
ncbi:hypothetical protein WH47_07046 [Habropoda laboriosa]|uniref:Uncharacterized protein n=1 Tax=Habropoda laboriosa TaxID=597456 RepID=A0A0L7RGM1_9HYME|nr:hypothetical protein WH47_07046 [Habropoda laboriosa]